MYVVGVEIEEEISRKELLLAPLSKDFLDIVEVHGTYVVTTKPKNQCCCLYNTSRYAHEILTVNYIPGTPEAPLSMNSINAHFCICEVVMLTDSEGKGIKRNSQSVVGSTFEVYQ